MVAIAAGALVFGALVALLAAWLLRRTLVVVTVNGESMEPTFRHGERVLVRRAGIDSVRPGQVVVVAPGRPQRLPHDYPLWMIKRLRAIPGDPVPCDEVPILGAEPEPTVPAARMVVLGDNPSGSDSRQLGYFYTANLLGVVVRRLPPRPTAWPS
jgi:signal peptidase I